MKIRICDPCYKHDGTMNKATCYIKWKRGIRIDLCNKHRCFCDNKSQSEMAGWLYE